MPVVDPYIFFTVAFLASPLYAPVALAAAAAGSARLLGFTPLAWSHAFIFGLAVTACTALPMVASVLLPMSGLIGFSALAGIPGVPLALLVGSWYLYRRARTMYGAPVAKWQAAALCATSLVAAGMIVVAALWGLASLLMSR